MTPEAAEAFAEEWIAAWNARDLPRILAHYAEDVHFRSPTAQNLVENGVVEGKAALEHYWTRALALIEHLHFELLGVFTGHDSLTILYRNHNGAEAAETFLFNADGKVTHSVAAYQWRDSYKP